MDRALLEGNALPESVVFQTGAFTDMEILHLRYFIRAAELNSISKAAAEFHVFSSAVSNHIKSLEQELGVPLFHRSGNRISLNANGEILYRHARRLLNLLEDTRKEIADNCGRLDYELTIATSTLPKLIPFIIRDFKRKFPEVRLRIVQYQKYINIDDTSSDLHLYASDPQSLAPCSRTIYQEEIGLAVSKDHPLADLRSVSAAHLAREKFIRRSYLSDFRQLSDKYFHILGIHPETVLISDYPPFINELVASNMGVALLPLLTWLYAREKNIHFLRIQDARVFRCINIQWRRNGYLSRAAEQFIQHITEYFQNLRIPQ